MSRENVEMMRRLVDAWNRGDDEDVLALVHPEVEFHNPPDAIERGDRYGAEGIRHVVETMRDTFDEYQVEIDEIVARGDQVAGLIRVRGRGRISGTTNEALVSHVLTFRDRKITTWRWFNDWAQALEAAGLRE